MEAVRKKMCSGVCFSLGVGNVIYSATSAEKYSCSVESGVTLAKLGVLLKICLFACDVEMFLIFNREGKLSALLQNEIFC